MSKICLLGDCHFGCRNDNQNFHEHFKKFYDEMFFPYLITNNISKVIQVGDIFDRRKFVNFNSLFQARKYFFDKFDEYNIELFTLLGNHDIAFKNTLKVNSPNLLLKGYKNIRQIRDFSSIDLYGTSFDFIPWLCEENIEYILKEMESSTSKVCFGHFEINGFEMDRGNVFKGGKLEKKDLKKYEYVISGHFHHKSDDGHIYYLGTPYQITWSDYNDPRGFYIFDTSNNDLEFIENPNQMFQKMTYDDEVQDKEYWNNFDFSEYKNTYVKILVINKKNPVLFDEVFDKLEKEGAYDIGIVEEFEARDIEAVDSIEQIDDTITLLNKWIDTQELNVDIDKLKSLMREIYIEALNTGKGE